MPNHPTLTKDAYEKYVALSSEGKSIKSIAEELGVSVSTLARWRVDNPQLHDEVMRAQETGFELLADSLLTIDEEITDVQRAKLKSDNIKWILSKRHARRYGDRIDVNITETIDITAALDEAKRRVLQPICNPTEVIDVQVVDLIEDSSNKTPDTESVVLDLESKKESK